MKWVKHAMKNFMLEQSDREKEAHTSASEVGEMLSPPTRTSASKVGKKKVMPSPPTHTPASKVGVEEAMPSPPTHTPASKVGVEEAMPSPPTHTPANKVGGGKERGREISTGRESVARTDQKQADVDISEGEGDNPLHITGQLARTLYPFKFLHEHSSYLSVICLIPPRSTTAK